MIVPKAAPKKHAAKIEKTGDYYPRSFLEYLRSACSVFAGLPKEHQRPLAANLWTATSTRLAHCTHEGAFTMHWRGRQAMYGTAKAFHQLNDTLGWFDMLEGAKAVQHIAQAWQLTERADTLAGEYFTRAHVERSDYAAGLIGPDGAAYRMPGDAIRSRTNNGGDTKHPRGAVLAAVEINGEALHAFHGAGEAWLLNKPCPAGFEWAFQAWDAIAGDRGPNGGTARARQRANDAIVQASALLHLAKSSNLPGYVLPVTYREYPSGRLFAEGAHNLQTCRREVRRAALMGAWDVDVSNCHWALIQQMAARIGLDAPAVSHYLANKKQVRAAVAMAGGVSESDAKSVLIGLIYGMNLQASESDRRRAIIDMVGTDAAARLRVFAPLLELFREVQQLRGAIIADYAARTTRKQCIVNDAGNAIALTATPAEKLAHVLQGAEAAILRSVISAHGPSLKLLAHDGWVMADRPDKAAMQAEIEAATGYRVELEISQL